MGNTIRFGRKLPVPSTPQFGHELRLMAASKDLVDAGVFDAQRTQPAEATLHDLVGSLSRKHGLSVDRAQMLVDRFADKRNTHAVAARSLAPACIHP